MDTIIPEIYDGEKISYHIIGDNITSSTSIYGNTLTSLVSETIVIFETEYLHSLPINVWNGFMELVYCPMNNANQNNILWWGL